jgi:tetratricopeptide (TPR) repeat protein
MASMSTETPQERAARLEAAGRWADLAGHYVDQLGQTDDLMSRLDLYIRAAELFEHRLEAPDNALLVLLQAFTEAPEDGLFAEALERLATQTSGWDDTFAVYEAALETSDDPLALHRRLITWYQQADRSEDANRHHAQVFVHDPTDAEAEQAYETWLTETEDWRGLVDLLTGRLNQATDADVRQQLLLLIADLLDQGLNAPDEALELLGQTYVETRDDGLELRMEHLAERTGAWKPLVRIYRRTLEHPFADTSQAAALHLKTAQLYETQLNNARRAADQYANVLAYEPDNGRALAALQRLFTAEGRYDELAGVLEQLAPNTPTPKARAERYVELGEIYATQLNDPQRAIDAWLKAAEAQPDHKPALAKLLGIYQETGHWEGSIRVLRKLAQLSEDLGKKARYFYAVGVIQRDKVEDHYVAVRTLDKALEADPTLVRAFQAIDEILTHDGDYARQDRYYRKMLVRARQHRLDDALVVSLARNLGEINRSRLHNYAEAIKAYGIVVKKRPQDVEAHAIIAQLYTLNGDLPGAAHAAFKRVQAQPSDPAGLHALARARLDAGALDGAWCTCQALVVLGQANADEQRFYEEGLRHINAQAQRSLEASDWQLVTWAGRDARIDQALATAQPAVGPLMAHSPKQLNLNPRKDQLDLEAASALGQIVKYISQLIGVRPASAWLSPMTRGLATANLNPPGLLVGPDMAERAFGPSATRVTRQLYLLSLQHVLATIDLDASTTATRLVAVLAAVETAAGGGSHGDPALVQAIEALPAGSLTALERVAPTLPKPLDAAVASWLDAVEHTANRLALLLSCDLAATVQMMRDEPPSFGGEITSRLWALLLFSVSEPYLELRRRLGYALPARA